MGATDIDTLRYAKLVKSRNSLHISEALKEIEQHLITLEAVKPKSFSVRTLIKTLKYHHRILFKRLDYFQDKNYTRARDKEHERNSIAMVNQLVKILDRSRIGTSKTHSRERKLNNVDRINSRGSALINGELLTKEEQIQIAVETAVKRGIDVNGLNRQSVIDTGFGHMLSDWNPEKDLETPLFKVPVMIDDDSDDNDSGDVLESLQKIQEKRA